MLSLDQDRTPQEGCVGRSRAGSVTASARPRAGRRRDATDRPKCRIELGDASQVASTMVRLVTHPGCESGAQLGNGDRGKVKRVTRRTYQPDVIGAAHRFTYTTPIRASSAVPAADGWQRGADGRSLCPPWSLRVATPHVDEAMDLTQDGSSRCRSVTS